MLSSVERGQWIKINFLLEENALAYFFAIPATPRAFL